MKGLVGLILLTVAAFLVGMILGLSTADTCGCVPTPAPGPRLFYSPCVGQYRLDHQ